jgi:Ser/Thr protein kinase RdoA (MazF antagonist)
MSSVVIRPGYPHPGERSRAARGQGGEDGSMGWEALDRWGDAARVEPLAGGVANDVWRLRVGGRPAVGRLGTRSDADLDWETRLLLHLDREGLAVPVPIPTTDGRMFVDGLVVTSYVDGGPPETGADWRRVAGALRLLHRATAGWPQRPGWRSSTDLLRATTGTKVDLGAMAPEAVARCRAAWARLEGRGTCVVHGDPNPGNVRLTADRVALIDWDESHVDVPDLDLALPHNAAGLDEAALDVAAQARAAWEAAVCWDPTRTDPFGVERLAEVRPVGDEAPSARRLQLGTLASGPLDGG